MGANIPKTPLSPLATNVFPSTHLFSAEDSILQKKEISVQLFRRGASLSYTFKTKNKIPPPFPPFFSTKKKKLFLRGGWGVGGAFSPSQKQKNLVNYTRSFPFFFLVMGGVSGTYSCDGVCAGGGFFGGGWGFFLRDELKEKLISNQGSGDKRWKILRRGGVFTFFSLSHWFPFCSFKS